MFPCLIKMILGCWQQTHFLYTFRYLCDLRLTIKIQSCWDRAMFSHYELSLAALGLQSWVVVSDRGYSLSRLKHLYMFLYRKCLFPHLSQSTGASYSWGLSSLLLRQILSWQSKTVFWTKSSPGKQIFLF